MNQVTNKILVFSGKFEDFTRTEIQNFAKSHGAKIAPGISAKVDYLVAGEKLGNSKRQKANKLGVPIISFKEFQKMLVPEGESAADFWTVELSGNESAEDFIEKIEQLAWDVFDPHEDGAALRDLLEMQEQKWGIHSGHLYCSNQIRKHLKLVHPYAHEDGINSKEVSPNGQWLATGNWIGESYERGGVLQIWEMKTGRVVNQLRVRGGIGWSNDVDGISWNPNSEEVGLSYDTNGVGVWDPFNQGEGPKIWAYVTDGWDHPPSYNWSGDGNSLFISYFYFKDITDDGRDESDRGCWIETYKRRGDMADHAIFGYHDDRKKPTYKSEEQNLPKYPTPKIHGDTVVFSHLQNGKGAGEFYDRPPTEDNPLFINHTDYSSYTDIDPTFPIVIDEQEHWGIAFEEGTLVVPENYPAEVYLNFSLGNKYAWPLNWVEHTRVKDLKELKKMKKKPALPYYMPTVFKTIKSTKKSSSRKKKFPTSEDKTYEDLVQLTIDTMEQLGGQGQSHSREFLHEAGLTEILRENPAKAVEIGKMAVAEDQALYAGELAMHCLQRGYKEEGEALFKFALLGLAEAKAYHLPKTHSILAICYYLKGNLEKMAAQEALALEARKQGHSNKEIAVFLNLWFMTDQTQKALEMLSGEWKEEEGMTSFDLPTPFYNLVWYGTMDQMLTIVQHFIEHKVVEEYDLCPYLSRKIIYDKCYERLEEGLAILGVYASHLVYRTICQGLALEKAPVSTELFKLYFSKNEPDSSSFVTTLLACIEKYPVQILELVKTNFFGLTEAQDWSYRYETCYEMGKIIGILNLWTDFDKDCMALYDEEYQACLMNGVAAKSSDEQLKEALLTKAQALLSGKNFNEMEALWSIWGSASVHSTRHDEILKEAIRLVIESDKDFGLGSFIHQISEENVLLPLYTVWKKMSKAKRYYNANSLFKLLCDQKNYDGLYDVLMLMPLDINERGQKTMYVLNELTDNRGYKFTRD